MYTMLYSYMHTACTWSGNPIWVLCFFKLKRDIIYIQILVEFLKSKHTVKPFFKLRLPGSYLYLQQTCPNRSLQGGQDWLRVCCSSLKHCATSAQLLQKGLDFYFSWDEHGISISNPFSQIFHLFLQEGPRHSYWAATQSLLVLSSLLLANVSFR